LRSITTDVIAWKSIFPAPASAGPSPLQKKKRGRSRPPKGLTNQKKWEIQLNIVSLFQIYFFALRNSDSPLAGGRKIFGPFLMVIFYIWDSQIRESGAQTHTYKPI
jgi:hypothetical protein